MKPVKQFNELKEKFYTAITTTENGLVQAGLALIEMTQVESHTYEILIRENEGMRADWLEMLERIGRNPSLAKLVLMNTYAASKALRLSNDKEVERIATKTVPVVEEREDGGLQTVHKRLPEFNRTEIDQVIQNGKLLNEEQQTEVIRQRKNKQAENLMTYWLHGRKITFRERVTFDVAELYDRLGKILEEQQPKVLAELQGEIQKRQVAG